MDWVHRLMIFHCILAGRAQQLRHWQVMRGPQPLPFLAIMTGLMAWKPSSALSSIGGGWVGGCCLRYIPLLDVAMKLASFSEPARCLLSHLNQLNNLGQAEVADLSISVLAVPHMGPRKRYSDPFKATSDHTMLDPMQEKSYYALRLPHGWWLFGLDLALVDDIDMCQCRRAGSPMPSPLWHMHSCLKSMACPELGISCSSHVHCPGHARSL